VLARPPRPGRHRLPTAAVAAASPLLNLAPQLRQVAPPDPSGLRATLAQALQEFERRARASGSPNEHVVAARYALCTFLDEAAANTPWGERIWAQNSLLIQFHNEAWGGEKFFQLMGKVAEQPDTHRDLLELFYLIISLGFEGRYRVLQNGAAQLEQVRERLFAMLSRVRSEPDRELSPDWRTTASQRKPLRDSLPLWAVVAVAAALTGLVYVGASFALNRQSDPTFANILALSVTPRTAVAKPAPTAAPAPDRLASQLAADVRSGRLVVQDLADRSIVLTQGDGLFDAGSATPSATFVELLDHIGAATAKLGGSVLVRGHTDNQPIRSARFPSNWHLSKARADAVAALLAARLPGTTSIKAEGMAESVPVTSNDSPEGRARNRRVEIVVFPPAPGN
jgi:type VI secretion system protein ImpK